MSQELPYFKFAPSEWLLNRISFQNYRVKGIFIDACSYYWHRNCSVTSAELGRKLGKTQLKVLLDGNFLVEKNGEIFIDFLDDQFAELLELKEKRIKSGRKGGQAKPKQSLSNASSLPKHLEEEEDKEEEQDITVPQSKTEGTKKRPDFIDQIIEVFIDEYKKVHSDTYEIVNFGKERAAAGKISRLHKKSFPDHDTDQALEKIREFFEICLNVEDEWLWQNMSPTLIISKYNEIRNAIKHGKIRKNSVGNNQKGISDERLAKIIVDTFVG